jgi:predicted RNA-binding Zn-ribbon protein involved in translation (DUF1610 family)
MRHLRRLKCRNDGYEPGPAETVCKVCDGEVWIWWCELHREIANTNQGCDQCGFAFNGRRFHSHLELRDAMASNWNTAAACAVSATLGDWIETTMSDRALANRLRSIGRHAATAPDAVLAAALGWLNPKLPLVWKGRSLSRGVFAVDAARFECEAGDLVTEVMTSSLAEWVADLVEHRWLVELSDQCRARAEWLGLASPAAANRSQWPLLLATASRLQAAAAAIKSEYAGAKRPEIDVLFGRAELSDSQALLLAAEPVEQLLTAEAAWMESVEQLLLVLKRVTELAGVRPCSRLDLERLGKKVEECLGEFETRKDAFRAQGFQPGSCPELAENAALARGALRRAFEAHDRAQVRIREIQALIGRGHIRRAVAEAAELTPTQTGFTDLELGFVAQAAASYRQVRRRLIWGTGVLAAVIIVAALVLKYLMGANQSFP